jgi:hypothetical protein
MSTLKKLLLLLIAIALIGLVSILVRNMLTTESGKVLEDASLEENTSLLVNKVTVQEKYIAGTLTIFGSVIVTNPCDAVNVSSAQAGENTHMITIETVKTDSQCEDAIADQLFEYSLKAPEDVMLLGSFNGNPIEFSRIRLGEGQEFSNPIENTKG